MSTSTALPIADSRTLRAYVREVARTYPRMLGGSLTLHVLAALTALAAPRLLGDLVEAVDEGTTTAYVDQVVMWLAGFLVVQTVLTRYARFLSQALGEQVLARLREDFVSNALALPVGTVESAGSGDLLTRTSRDVDQLGWSVRWALPEWTIAVVTAVVTFIAAISVGWWVILPCLLGMPPLVAGLRWYLARAKAGYLRESASYSTLNATLTETVEGARTVEALGLGRERVAAIDDDITESYDAERYTLYLRTVFFPSMELSYLIPTVGTLLLGGWLYARGEVTLGEVTTATLYVQMLIDPVDRIVSILDELQVGQASLARLLGVAMVPDDRTPTGRVPVGERLDAHDVRFAYVEGRDVLHGVDLAVEPGSGSPWSGRPALASRRSGGCSPASIRHGRARSPSAASVGASCRWTTCAATSPWSPRSTTCSSAPCARTSPWPRRPVPPTTTSGRRSTPSTPSPGWSCCPTSWTPSSGRAAASSPTPRPSRSPWPGWCSPTRTPWCWTRRRPSSTRARPGTWSARWRPCSTVAR